MNNFLGKLKEMLIGNWKTTAAGLVTGIAVILSSYGVHLDDVFQDNFKSLIAALGLILIGIFSKDGGGDEK